MTKKANNALSIGDGQRRRAVRVKLGRRINNDLRKLYPPDGQGKVWWDRLKRSLGTSSSDFVNASLLQLQAAARFPGSGISETAMNAALAMIEAAAPQNEIEGALAIQMACTHTAAMSVLARFAGVGGTQAGVVAFSSAATRLLRAYAAQVETLRRLRHGGDQYVRVEHVQVSDGGQALIGNVKTRESQKQAVSLEEREQEKRTDQAGPALSAPDYVRPPGDR